MKVTRENAREWINGVIEAKLKLDEQWDLLESLTGASCESPLAKAVGEPIDKLIGAVEYILDDVHGSLSWYVWDNDLGQNMLEHEKRFEPVRMQVCCIDDLLDVMGY